MKQGIPTRRARGRGNPRGRQQSNIRNQQMDSNGPVGRLRGTPQQILDRYSAQARDASSAGDMVLAENLWQHAEHYARLLNAAQPQQQQQGAQNGQRQGNDRDDGFDSDDQDDSGNDSNNRQDTGRQDTGRQDTGRQDTGRQDTGRQDTGRQDTGRQDTGREEKPEPIVLKPNPEPVAPVDQSEAEQPEAPSVWSKADIAQDNDGSGASGESGDAESRQTPPRRRRRTRFPRQTEGSEANAGEDAGSGASPSLKLPDDPSPAALVDLLTRVEDSNAGGKPRATKDGDD